MTAPNRLGRALLFLVSPEDSTDSGYPRGVYFIVEPEIKGLGTLKAFLWTGASILISYLISML